MNRYINLIKYVSNWWDYFPVKFKINHTDPILFTCRNNIKVEVPRRLLNTFKEVFFKDAYGRYIGNNLSSAPTVIDIGANVGYFSLYIFSRFPKAKVIAFEPIPVNQELLQKHLQYNPEINLIIDKRAVFGKSQKISLTYNAKDSFTTDASIFDTASADSTLVVDTITIPEIFEGNDIENCDLLKLDCEGAEYDILYNCPDDYFNRISNIALEVHAGKGPLENIHALAGFLSKKGYAVKIHNKELLWCRR